MAKVNTLGKVERLKSRKSIQQLFLDGRKILLPPYRVLYQIGNGSPGLSFGSGVSAKNFKRAVDRNRIKRLTREAYRLQKSSLNDLVIEKMISLNVFFIYTAREIPTYKEIYPKVGTILLKLTKQV